MGRTRRCNNISHTNVFWRYLGRKALLAIGIAIIIAYTLFLGIAELGLPPGFMIDYEMGARVANANGHACNEHEFEIMGPTGVQRWAMLNMYAHHFRTYQFVFECNMQYGDCDCSTPTP